MLYAVMVATLDLPTSHNHNGLLSTNIIKKFYLLLSYYLLYNLWQIHYLNKFRHMHITSQKPPAYKPSSKTYKFAGYNSMLTTCRCFSIGWTRILGCIDDTDALRSWLHSKWEEIDELPKSPNKLTLTQEIREQNHSHRYHLSWVL
jgi:hypothetical protein